MKSRTCLDCDFVFNPSEPAWRTRCRRCYALHRQSLKMRECEVCGKREKRESWKQVCAGCLKSHKLEEKEKAAGPIEKVTQIRSIF